MAYVAEGIDQRAEVLQDAAADSLVFYPKHDGAPDAAPSSAFVTVVDPSGRELVPRTAATITGSKLSFTQAWPKATYPLDEEYIALWEWTVGGIVYSDRQYFDVVKNKLPCLIDTSDLQEVYPNLLNQLKAIGEQDASKFIRRAWSELLDAIRSSGRRPSLITDKVRLINPAVHLALSFTCNALAREAMDIWSSRAKAHSKRWNELFGQLGELRYDATEDGVTDGKTSVVGGDWTV